MSLPTRCCGSCAWFEPQGKGNAVRTGVCMFEPPTIHLVMAPNAVGPPRPAVQGLRPPTSEGDRCSKWTSA